MSLRHSFYVQPMNWVYLEMAAMYLLWTIGMLVVRGKAKRLVGVICAVLSVGLILSYTLIGRKGGGDLSLIPFITFVNAKTQPELYRTLFMNVFLFLPLGLSLPFALPKKLRHPVLFTMAVGFFLSVTVEGIQFFGSLGRCETDDVLMNTLGTAAGASSYLLQNGILTWIRRHNKRNHRRYK